MKRFLLGLALGIIITVFWYEFEERERVILLDEPPTPWK